MGIKLPPPEKPRRSRVFVTGSLWSLLTYLLISSEEEIKRTKYFFANTGIHPSVRKNFKHHVLNLSWDNNKPFRLVQFVYTFAPLYYRIRFPYLINAEVFGIDQGWAIRSVIGRNHYTLIEDGVGDYSVNRHIPVASRDKLRRFIWGPIYRHDFGRNDHCNHIVLTQPFTNEELKEKAKYYNLPELWEASSESKKRLILSKFNITENDVEDMKRRPVILLTQPLDKDANYSEEEKIKLYRKMAEPYGLKNVIIKPHPRETTDYTKAIPEALTMRKVVPFQLFSIIGVKFKTAVTVCSTAALSLQNTGTEIDFKGSELDPRIVKAYGIITKDSYK
jgi:hypothetical protein